MVASIPSLEVQPQIQTNNTKKPEAPKDSTFGDLLDKSSDISSSPAANTEVKDNKENSDTSETKAPAQVEEQTKTPAEEKVDEKTEEKIEEGSEEGVEVLEDEGTQAKEPKDRAEGPKTSNQTNKDLQNPTLQKALLIDKKIDEGLDKAKGVAQVAEDGITDVQNEIDDISDLKNKADKQITKTVADIKNEADIKNLNLKKVDLSNDVKNLKLDSKDIKSDLELSKSESELKDKLQTKALQASLLIENSLKDKTQDKAIIKTPEDIKKEQLLIELLNKYDPAKNTQRQEANKSETIQYKIGDGDKAMVIQRGATPPKNIVDSKLRNEQTEKEFIKELTDILNTKVDGKEEAKLQAKDIKEAVAAKVVTPGLQNIKNEVDAKSDLQSLKAQMDDLPLKNIDMSGGNKDDASKDEEGDPQNLIDKKEKSEKTEKSEDKTLQNIQQVKQEVNYKNAIARESIKNFAAAFKEELQNYKPPITKINLELNPANLGEVTLNISKKGNDLQVNITSNNNAMNLFAQNAVELRNNLMQIGFANLDLNFHSNDQGGNNANQESDQDQKLQDIESNALNGEVPTELDIILPDYA